MLEANHDADVPPPPYWTESGDLEGWVHTTENFSSGRGPGLRYVLTLSGCPLRCSHCDVPEIWERHESAPAMVADVLADIGRHKTLLRGRGGVTLSGGEPLLQHKFCRAILDGCKAMGLHTALDTVGYYGDLADDSLLANVDLVLLNIKAFSAERHRALTGVDLAPTLRFAEVLAALNKAVWLRYKLVPGVNDKLDDIAALARYAAELGNIERVEIQPFVQHGGYKWRDRGLDYPLANIASSSEADLEAVRELFRAERLRVY